MWFTNFSAKSRYNKRIKNPTIVKTVYHELGHVYLALLFDSYIKLSKCFIGKDIISAMTSQKNWNGGVSYDIDLKAVIKSIDLSDRMACVTFGGMCSQNLHFSKFSEFKQKIEFFLSSPDQNMNNEGGIQDFETAKPILIRNHNSLNKIYIDYLREILYFNFKYLSDKNVWQSIELFANILLSKKYGIGSR